MSRPASPFITCYCSGHCPDNKPNGTCIAKFGSYCFTAIEEVYDSERNSYEFEKSYGCLPPEEGGLMQCKGNLVPHEVPKSIICCNNASYCNLNLEPELPDGIGGMSMSNQHTYGRAT